jgi:hypothetical protein
MKNTVSTVDARVRIATQKSAAILHASLKRGYTTYLLPSGCRLIQLSPQFPIRNEKKEAVG